MLLLLLPSGIMKLTVMLDTVHSIYLGTFLVYSNINNTNIFLCKVIVTANPLAPVDSYHAALYTDIAFSSTTDQHFHFGSYEIRKKFLQKQILPCYMNDFFEFIRTLFIHFLMLTMQLILESYMMCLIRPSGSTPDLSIIRHDLPLNFSITVLELFSII